MQKVKYAWIAFFFFKISNYQLKQDDKEEIAKIKNMLNINNYFKLNKLALEAEGNDT